MNVLWSKVDLDLKSRRYETSSDLKDHAMRSPSLIENADGIRSVVGLGENILTNGHDGTLG